MHNNSAVQAELTFVQYLIKSLKLSPGSQAKECIHFAISYLFKSNHIVFLKTNDINKPPSISFPIKQGKSNKLNKFFKFYFSLEFYPLPGVSFMPLKMKTHLTTKYNFDDVSRARAKSGWDQENVNISNTLYYAINLFLCLFGRNSFSMTSEIFVPFLELLPDR